MTEIFLMIIFEAMKEVILFDGVCNFCTGWVLWVIRRDHKRKYVFSALQMPEAQKLLNQHPDLKVNESVILIRDQKIFIKSDAALKIASGLGGVYRLVNVLYIFPGFIRNAVYDFIGRNRYRWFGKKEMCFMPDESIRSRFLF